MRTRTSVIWWTIASVTVAVLLALIPVSAKAAGGGTLCLFGSNATTTTSDAMMAGTSPAITALSGSSDEVAYQSSGGDLATYADSNGAQNTTGYAMDPKSSPAITSYGGAPTVAFSSSADQLYAGNGTSESPEGVVLYAGTSPSLAALSASSVQYAYEGSNADSYTGSPGAFTDQGAGMEAGTSPSVAAVDTTGGMSWETAQEVNTTDLWEIGPISDDNTSQGMNTSSSPSITAVGVSKFEIAFEANTDVLYVWGNSGDYSTGQAMAGGTNPSIAAVGSGFEVAFQGSNGDLWVDGSDGTEDTGHAMAAGTSPAITATAAGYEVAYQCAPVVATPPVTVTETTTTPTPSTHASGRRVRARLELYAIPDKRRRTTYVVFLHDVSKLPRSARVTIACRALIKDQRCPRLGRLAARHRTITEELAVAARRTYRRDNTLLITVAARRYRSEVFAVIFPGVGKPHWTARYAS